MRAHRRRRSRHTQLHARALHGYTELLPDVYLPLVDAFDRVMGSDARSPHRRDAAPLPFELCECDSLQALQTPAHLLDYFPHGPAGKMGGRVGSNWLLQVEQFLFANVVGSLWVPADRPACIPWGRCCR